jgi:hypothetical protein
VGLICAVERLPQANQKEKPYRLTLTGVTILDELPKDEEPKQVGGDVKGVARELANRLRGRAVSWAALLEWSQWLDSSGEDTSDADSTLAALANSWGDISSHEVIDNSVVCSASHAKPFYFGKTVLGPAQVGSTVFTKRIVSGESLFLGGRETRR